MCTWLPGWASQPETTWHVFVWVTPWEQWRRGTWCSGITSASHAEGPGLNPQCVHAQHTARSLVATSTDSVSAVLFVGLVSWLSIPLSARAREGSTLRNAGPDDLGGFSTPILLSCFCSKKCSKSSRVHFPIAEDVCTWLPGWASQPETTWHVFVWVTPWEQWLRGTWCSGITSASHAEDPGLNPQCVHAQHPACFVAGERLLSSSCHLHRQRFSCAVCRPCILLVHTAVCTGSGGQCFAKCRAGWFRRFFYTNLAELFLFKKML